MTYRIERNDMTKLVYLTFDGDIPVEVRVAIKEAGFLFRGYDANWTMLGSMITDDEINRIIGDALASAKPRPVMSKEEENALRDEYLVRKVAKDGHDRWKKYYRDNIGALVRLTTGEIFCIEKPRIETSFCFGESGYDADDAYHMAHVARTNEDYFKERNLRDLKTEIDLLSYRTGLYNNERLAAERWGCDGVVWVSFCSRFDRDGKFISDELSEEDRERVLEGYRKAYKAFEKRLDTYLKRYGLSKVRSWTYWRDA